MADETYIKLTLKQFEDYTNTLLDRIKALEERVSKLEDK